MALGRMGLSGLHGLGFPDWTRVKAIGIRLAINNRENELNWGNSELLELLYLNQYKVFQTVFYFTI
jgi:hypothetical protein